MAERNPPGRPRFGKKDIHDIAKGERPSEALPGERSAGYRLVMPGHVGQSLETGKEIKNVSITGGENRPGTPKLEEKMENGRRRRKKNRTDIIIHNKPEKRIEQDLRKRPTR